MPLTAALKDSGINRADTSAYATNSISIVAGRLYLVFVVTYRRDSINPAAMASVTGLGQTFVQDRSVHYDASGSGRARVTCFSMLANATTSGTLSLNHSETVGGVCWGVVEVTGAPTDTLANAIAQSTSLLTGAATSGTLTFAALVNASSMTVAGCAHSSSVPEGHTAGQTQLLNTWCDDPVSGLNDALNIQYAINDTTANWSWPSSFAAGMLGYEVRNLGLILQSVGGSIAPTGTIGKMKSTSFAGGITPSGVLTAIRTKAVALAGAIVPTGALTRAAFIVYQKAMAGAITPTGSLVTRWYGITYRTFTGSITPSGTLGVLWSGISFVVLSGRITPSGSLIPTYLKRLLIGFGESSDIDIVPDPEDALDFVPKPEDTSLDFNKLDSYDG